MILLHLFWSFFQVGLFSVGGTAALPLVQEQVVARNGWLTMAEFTDLATISEMTPGPIAINAATFVGIRLAGIPGALVATAGAVLPGCAVVALLAWVYFRYRSLRLVQSVLDGLRPAVVALIASAGLSILVLALWGEAGAASGGVNWIAAGLFLAALLALRRFRWSPIWVMLGAGVLGGAAYLLI